MTLRECYDQMNGSYDDAKARLMMDSMIERFLQKFLEDKTMEDLRRAVASGDIPLSFRQAHTLKGVAANLAFTGLQKAASDLTEQLRPQAEAADPRGPGGAGLSSGCGGDPRLSNRKVRGARNGAKYSHCR